MFKLLGMGEFNLTIILTWVFLLISFFFFFFFDNSKQTSLVEDRTLDVFHGKDQEVPLDYKGQDNFIDIYIMFLNN